MKTVTFKYAPGERVASPFGDVGFISMAAIEENDTISYYVKGQYNSNWLTEDQLKPAEGNG